MTVSNASCRLCGSNDISVCLTQEHAARSIQRLLRPEELGRDDSVDLRVYQCRDCGFVQLITQMDTDYYDDYVMTTSHSSQMNQFQREQATTFVDRFELKGKRVVEIGCGDGNYLALLKELGAVTFGIEPSAPFRQMALNRGLDVSQGYCGRGKSLPAAPFDAFVTRQVFEHVFDPNDFLQGIRENLTADAAGLVEVPSLEQAMEQGRFYDFFADHVNYFSAATLRHALERNGFTVLDISRGMNGEYNVAHVQRSRDYDFPALQHTLDSVSSQMRTFINEYQAAGRRVAVWGAGGKGITVMAVAQVSGVAYVVDSDPYKIGAYTPVTHIPICGPEQLLKDPVDAVIVTALAYRDEILAQLRDTLGFQGVVAVLGPTLQVFKGSH